MSRKSDRPMVLTRPRLLSIEGAAHYLGDVSRDTIESYIREGKLHTRRLPSPAGKEFLRRVVIEIEELDRLIEQGFEV